MTKIKGGVNPDYADFDELDADALDAVAEYEQGILSFDELKTLIGAEAAEEMRRSRFGDEMTVEDLFDDPEDF